LLATDITSPGQAYGQVSELFFSFRRMVLDLNFDPPEEDNELTTPCTTISILKKKSETSIPN
jgi:hypothetical protein